MKMDECGDVMPLEYNEDCTIAYAKGKTDHGGVLTKMEFFDKNDLPTQMPRANYSRNTEFDDKGTVVAQYKMSVTWFDQPKYEQEPEKKAKPSC